MEMNRWLSVDEVAAYLGVKRETIYKWISRRKLPAHKIGRLWKFRVSEIDRWVVSGASGHTRSNQSGRHR